MAENERRVRIVPINFFIKNNGVIRWLSFFIWFILIYEGVLCGLMFLDYHFVNNPNGNDIWVT